MTKQEAENSLCLCGYAGSITYGTNNMDSDTAIKGIFIPTKEYYIGLGEVEQVVGKDEEFDYTYYSIKKFFRLALNANPNIWELLWLRENHYLWNKVFYPDIGRRIIDKRSIFLSKKARHSYLGYAWAQLHRMDKLNKNVGQNIKRAESVEKFGYDVKNGYHLVRLLKKGLEILVDEELNVFREDAGLLKEIRDGKFSYNQLVDMFREYEHLIEEAYIRTSLPKNPDFHTAEKLLMELIEEVRF